MYEVAPVAGNKVEAACALRSLQQIMGQISSSHGSSGKKSSKYPRHSAVPSGGRIKEEIYRDHLYKGGKDSVRLKELSGRPVTISEMNAYNIEKNDKDKISGDHDILRKSIQPAHREFFTVGEGYHKTDNCYYKTPDGGYHKLPQDSFHKTSEGCYVKLADGSFRRLDEVKAAVSKDAAGSGDTSVSSQSRYKNQMMRFLRRSKSHTPGTIKEMQKEKAAAQANNTSSNQNRRVMVTMMDGGLPVVATSKQPDYHRPSKTKERTKDSKGKESKHKVKIMLVNRETSSADAEHF